MTNVDKTHRFFKEKVYSNLAAFAFSPIGWAFKMENHGSITMPNFGKLFVAALLAPILVPATIVTSSIALCFAGVAALFHGLSVILAGITDCYSNANNRTMTPA